jgi:hypothetical protein
VLSSNIIISTNTATRTINHDAPPSAQWRSSLIGVATADPTNDFLVGLLDLATVRFWQRRLHAPGTETV